MPKDHQRTAGILIPAFSARHEQDFGIGDTLALRHWIDWASKLGVGFIQLLPINEHGAEESPYSAISSVALDPIYLALTPDELPWLAQDEVKQAIDNAAPLRELHRIDYRKVRDAKRNLLELAWSKFDQATAKLRKEFDQFRSREADWLEEYCEFRYLMAVHGESLTWDEWPEHCRTPHQAHYFIKEQRRHDATAVDYRLGFFAFAQWLSFRQWRALRDHADQAGVKLMGDMPIGISRHSCDVFFNRNDFHLDWCGGAPAEGYNPENPFIHQWGQNWGIPLYRWDRMAANGYTWWHRRIARMGEFFRMFRLDHILGFYRIYAFPWTPRDNHRFINLSHEQAAQLTGGLLPRWWEHPDDTPEHRAANHHDGDRRLRGILAQTKGMDIIAEDLGWVPDYVRPHLASLGIAGFKIPHWDCDAWGHPTQPERFIENTFATYSTHDHPPIQQVWKSCAATIERHRHHPESVSHDQLQGARGTIRILCEFSGIPIKDDHSLPPYSESIRLRLIKALLSSNARYAAFMITECFDIDERINEPGLHHDRNWTFRLPWTLAQLEAEPHLQEICRQLKTAIALHHRTPEKPAKSGKA